ncbi:PadR family transcriptional regulator [Isoptericola sp. NEAU-Y5]|uniref:PadR family transcriptional regulator n=1 Tax=Isoptericola luteus TaxID=2879484 RepID=A0ABS7ZJ05_9MICO|nr:PadR family transcriptional regulator [Isoptericola sp. NEAU-Y5]MCA5894462.1 PadR family transcriptional regulator [Isoptericola sp. NEAU-Y5]
MHPRHTHDFPYDNVDPRGARRRRGDFPEGGDAPRRGRPDGRGRGFGPGFGPGTRGGGRGRRAGRGEIRAAILLLLTEQPMHGYQVITELADRTDGGWRPSPGAVYPAISQLQDEGLVAVAEDGGRRLATLTDAGRAHVAEHRAELGTPWETFTADPRRGGHELHAAMRALGGAVEQVARAGSAEQAAAAAALVDRARREVYLLLAGEAPAGDSDAGTDTHTDE